MGKRILIISKQLVMEILKPGERHYEIINDGLPADTEIVNVMLTFPQNDLALKLQSSEWPEIPDGHPIPYLDTRLKSLPSVVIVQSNPDRSLSDVIYEDMQRAEQAKTWRDKAPLL